MIVKEFVFNNSLQKLLFRPRVSIKIFKASFKSGPNVIKLFLYVIYEFSLVFVRLGWISLPVTYSGLLLKLKNNGQESYITLPPGVNIMKIFPSK